MEYTFYDLSNDKMTIALPNQILYIIMSDENTKEYTLAFDKERIPEIVDALNSLYGLEGMKNNPTHFAKTYFMDDNTVNYYEGGGVRQKEEGKPRIDLVHMSFVHDVMDYWSEGHTIELINAMKGTELGNYNPVITAASLVQYEFGEYIPNDTIHYYEVLGQLLLGLGDTMTYGAITQGYGERNWEKMLGDDARQRYGRSLLRHTCQYLAGYDDEPHLYRALFNCMGIWFWNRENEVELW